MANCIAKCTGIDGSRQKDASRLGARAARGEANTWNTFSTTFVRADGSGEFEVRQNGRLLHRFEWGPENEPPPPPRPEETPDDIAHEEEG